MKNQSLNKKLKIPKPLPETRAFLHKKKINWEKIKSRKNRTKTQKKGNCQENSRMKISKKLKARKGQKPRLKFK